MTRPAALAGALLALLLAPAAARASLTVTPASTQAGGHTDVTIHADFASSPSRTVLRFPRGLIGNPSATPKCPIATFEAGGSCSASEVGSAVANGGLASGAVYNLQPRAGEPARLGIAVSVLGLPLITVRNQASVSVRPDGGLNSTIDPVDGGPTGLQSLDLTLFSSFMRLPTSCVPATTTIEAPPNPPQSASFTPSGCASVPFHPGAAAHLETTQRSVPSGAAVTLTLPSDNSDVRRAQVVLPVGTTLSPGVANGLQACTSAQFASQAGCPGASQIGTVAFATPLLGTLGGKVFFGAPFRLFIDVNQQGVRLRLAGDVRLDPATGRITTVFDNLPQVPFSSFALSFKGGPKAVLANPGTCGTKTLAATLTPWSGTAARTATASFTINRGCGPVPFRPALTLSADSTAAGRPAGASTITVSRPDLDQDVSRVTTELPPGLAGSLTGIPTCPETNANAGTCPAGSRVGSVSAVVGTGAAPVTLSGTVFLTGPFDGGLAGLAIVIPARVGPVNLGTAVVRASLALRPADGGVTVRTARLPRLVGGVPVSIRRLALRLDRPGFIRNASSCAPQQVRAILEGSGGSSATVTAPYQATDCAGLRFQPKISATVGARGRNGRKGKPPLRTVVTVPDGQAATQTAVVHLPPSLSVDVSRLPQLCRPAQLAVRACPATSQVGTVTAATPLLPVPLTGPVYLAQPRSDALPGLSLLLGGPVSLRLDGAVQFSKAGTSTTFAGIPDVPLSRLELSFFGGKPGALVVTKSLCKGKVPRLTADFTGHNGATASLKVRMRVRGCRPTATLRLRGLPKHPRLTLRVRRARGAAALRRVTVTLPKRLRGVAKRARRGLVAKADGKRVKRRLTRHKLTISSRRNMKTITVTLRRGALRAGKGVKRRSRLTFKIATRNADGRRATLRPHIRGR